LQKPTHTILGATFTVIVGLVCSRHPFGLRLSLGFLDPFGSLSSSFSSEVAGGSVLLLQGAIFGVIPDLDLVFKGILDHRCGLTHSLVSVLILFPLLAVLFHVSPLIGLFSTFSHWISDAITIQGVRVWGVSPGFFLNHRRDFRLAEIRSNSKIANLSLWVICLLLLQSIF
jgi:membrane-bound metal-dependent hydrolase YbcI (DUF457 family)